ncbi:MAG: hypothetical protein JWN41_945 [Thermoleophilia bacterium]|nr:hypothetical protein [Thermoleophilia bacterium]
MSRLRTHRLSYAVVAFLIAVAAGVTVFAHSQSESSPKSVSSRGGAVATSKVWVAGAKWAVRVAQDGAAISPDRTHSVSFVTYRFRVGAAPKPGGVWDVAVTQDGAEAQFVRGWHLGYTTDKRGCMRLTKVSQGTSRRMDADVASIVLGVGFPYKVTYCAMPVPTSTVKQSRLMAQQILPPTSLPSGGGTNGAAPPTNAPSVGAGQTPPGAPPVI